MPDKYPPISVGLSRALTTLGTLVVMLFPLLHATDMKPGDAVRYE